MRITVETVVKADERRLACLEQPGGHQAMERRLGRLAHDQERRRFA